MFRLASILFPIIATTLGGAGVIAVLSAKMATPTYIVGAFAAGVVLALPVSAIVGRSLYRATRESNRRT